MSGRTFAAPQNRTTVSCKRSSCGRLRRSRCTSLRGWRCSPWAQGRNPRVMEHSRKKGAKPQPAVSWRHNQAGETLFQAMLTALGFPRRTLHRTVAQTLPSLEPSAQNAREAIGGYLRARLGGGRRHGCSAGAPVRPAVDQVRRRTRDEQQCGGERDDRSEHGCYRGHPSGNLITLRGVGRFGGTGPRSA